MVGTMNQKEHSNWEKQGNNGIKEKVVIERNRKIQDK